VVTSKVVECKKESDCFMVLMKQGNACRGKERMYLKNEEIFAIN